MDKQKIKQLIETDEDFVNAPRFKNSMKTALANYSEFSDRQIAQMLMIDEEEVEILYRSAIMKIRQVLKV